MKTWVKTLLGLGVGGGIFAAWRYWKIMQGTFQDLIVSSSGRIHKVDQNGLDIRLNLLIKNPSKGTFKIKFPFLIINYKGEEIATSQLVNTEMVVPSYGEARIDNIKFQISGLTAIRTVADMITAASQGQSVQIEVKTKSSAKVGAYDVPFERSQFITLKK